MYILFHVLMLRLLHILGKADVDALHSHPPAKST